MLGKETLVAAWKIPSLRSLSRRRSRRQRRRVRSPGALLVACFALVLGGADLHTASAACPDTPAECLGSAAHFALVAQGRAFLGVSYLAEDGIDPFWTWTTIEGDVCADRVSAVGPPPNSVGGYNTVVQGNLAVLATTGLGVVARFQP